ncbi:DUF1654 domain-containing protein [Pseudomonas sp. ZS1P83]
MAKAKKAPAAPTPPSLLDLMGLRVQKIINSPGAQKAKEATLHRSPDEPEDDWKQLMQDIGENENVTVEYLEDGGAFIHWTVPSED